MLVSPITGAEAMSDDTLLMILKISSFLLSKQGRDFAITNLDNRQFLSESPSRRLEFARQYRIPQWMARAVEQLMASDLRQITPDEFNQLGYAYHIISTRQKNLDLVRRRLAFFPYGENVPASQYCALHRRCRESWRAAWKDKVLPTFLHPETPLPLAKGLEFIQGMEISGYINSDCREAMVAKVASSNPFSAYRLAVEAAVRLVGEHFGITGDM